MTVTSAELAKCACLNVSYNPKDLGKGCFADRWTCNACGNKFVHIYWYEQLEKQIAERSREMSHMSIKSRIETLESLASKANNEVSSLVDYLRLTAADPKAIEKAQEAYLHVQALWAYVFGIDREVL